MTTEWVSGGGNPFCHNDMTKNWFPVVEFHLVSRKLGMYLNSNFTSLFSNDHRMCFRWRKPILSPRFEKNKIRISQTKNAFYQDQASATSLHLPIAFFVFQLLLFLLLLFSFSSFLLLVLVLFLVPLHDIFSPPSPPPHRSRPPIFFRFVFAWPPNC
jgi:hypothetical protein